MAVYKTSNSGLLTRREYTSFLAGNSQFVPNYTVGAYDSIATANITTPTKTITFSSIPSTYTHLQIRFLSQSNRSSAGSGDYFSVRFNSDTGSNYYSGHQLGGNGTAAYSYVNGAGTEIYVERVAESTSGANIFAAGTLDILDYADTNKYKTTRSLLGFDTNSSGQINLASGLWRSTAAISSITIRMVSADHTQYSQFALYGIKGA